MNILMVTADHLMIDRRILQEAKTLVQQGHQVVLLAGFECPKRESYVFEGIKIERFCYDWSDSRFITLAKRFKLIPGTKAYTWLWKGFNFWAKKIAKINSFDQFILDRTLEYQVDLIHVHDFPMLSPGVALAKIRKTPLIYDAHELYYAQTQLPPKIQKKYKRQENKLIKHANVVITVNPYIAKLMAERYKIELPEVILNAAPFKEKEVKDILRENLGLANNQKIVLYQGWISANRGIENLVEAAQHFNENICLVIIGYGDFEQHLKQLVAERNITKRVHFYGGVPSEDLHALTCNADLGVIPYYGVDENNYYCSPNKLFEFMVSGIPIIANNLPFLADMITQYENGVLTNLNSPQNLAKDINTIFADNENLHKLKVKAKKAGEHLNWSREEKKLLNIYARVMG